MALSQMEIARLIRCALEAQYLSRFPPYFHLFEQSINLTYPLRSVD